MLLLIGKWLLLLVIIGVGLLFLLYLRQDSMVFPRRHYYSGYELQMLPGTVPLEYNISCGKQKGWYVPPRQTDDPTSAPARLWVMFGGNGSVALSWRKIVEYSPDAQAGFLLVDYPGYGFCEGEPSVNSINESAEAIVVRLAEHLDIPLDELLDRPVRVMGHSLGSAVAVGFALRHKTDRIVMVAPFTSLRAMADGLVTPAFGWLLRHRWDNIEALNEVVATPDPPEIIVVHGSTDTITPVHMGRKISEALPDHVEYIEVEGADHGSILEDVWKYTAP